MSTPLRIGFLLSGVLHAAIVLALNLPDQAPSSMVEGETRLALNLAMFSAPPSAVVEEAVVETAAEPEVDPIVDPVVEPPVPPTPEPVEPALVSEPPPPPAEPEPVVQQAPEPRPRPVTRKVVRPPVEHRPAEVVHESIETAPAHSAQAVATDVPRAPIVDPAPPTPDPGAEALQQAYLAALAAQIDRSKFYPRQSRRRQEQGTVVVSFVVERDGRLTDLLVLDSSGFERLDDAAIKTLQKASPVRPIPQTLGRERWSISVPIAFQLSG